MKVAKTMKLTMKGAGHEDVEEEIREEEEERREHWRL